jgi:ribonuclease E
MGTSFERYLPSEPVVVSDVAVSDVAVSDVAVSDVAVSDVAVSDVAVVARGVKKKSLTRSEKEGVRPHSRLGLGNSNP